MMVPTDDVQNEKMAEENIAKIKVEKKELVKFLFKVFIRSSFFYLINHFFKFR